MNWQMSYIDTFNGDRIAIKRFPSDKAAYEWVRETRGIVPLKLGVWSEMTQSFDMYITF